MADTHSTRLGSSGYPFKIMGITFASNSSSLRQISLPKRPVEPVIKNFFPCKIYFTPSFLKLLDLVILQK